MFELDDARRDELVEAWGRRLVARGLGAAAVFLLEAHKPIAGITAQATVAFQPLIQPLIPLNLGELAAFMRDVGNIERLIQCIEQLEYERAEQQAARRKRRRLVRRRARRIRALRRQRR